MFILLEGRFVHIKFDVCWLTQKEAALYCKNPPSLIIYMGIAVIHTGACFFANGQATLLATGHAYLGAYVSSTAKDNRRTPKTHCLRPHTTEF